MMCGYLFGGILPFMGVEHDGYAAVSKTVSPDEGYVGSNPITPAL